MNLPVKPNDRFRHFKTGNYYKIISIFTWEPTKEISVLYESEKTAERWGRTLNVFLEEVAKGEQKVPRFEKVADGATPLTMYGLEEKYDEQNQPYWEVRHWAGDIIATLKGGCAAIIVLSFMNMLRQSEQRGNDYMAGVVQGCTHYQLLAGSSNS